MWMRLVLVLPLLAVTVGCASMGNPVVRADYFEVQHQGVMAMGGSAAAFDRIDQLSARWERRADDCLPHRLAFWDRANRARAGQVAEQARRLSLARKPLLAQQTQVEVMANALRDLESEFDGVIALLADSDAPPANQVLAAEQKYAVRRMQHSLSQMSGLDMGDAVEAADTFGRDVIEFQRQLDASLNGSEEAGIEPPGNSEVEESLAQIEELFAGYVADSADDLLENVVYRYDAWMALADLAAVHGAPVVRQQAQAGGTHAPGQGSSGSADDQSGGEPADDEPVDDEPVDDEPAGDEPAGDEPAGDEDETGEAGEDAAA